MRLLVEHNLMLVSTKVPLVSFIHQKLEVVEFMELTFVTVVKSWKNDRICEL